MNDVVKKTSQQATIADLLEANRGALTEALPKQVKLDRFLRVAMNAITKNPDLQKCTATSLYGAIMQSAQFGLEIGLMNQAHLVPYWNSDKKCFEAQFQIGYMGLRDMAECYGDVVDGDANPVYEKDEFNYELGDSPYVKHKPALDQDRGELIAFYAWAQPKQGKIKVAVMSKAEVDEHRDLFAKTGKDGKPILGPAWGKTFVSMAIKTVMRRLYKMLARSPQLREAIALDELQEVQIPQRLGAVVEQEAVAAARSANAQRARALQLEQVAPVSDGATTQDAAVPVPPAKPTDEPTPISDELWDTFIDYMNSTNDLTELKDFTKEQLGIETLKGASGSMKRDFMLKAQELARTNNMTMKKFL